MQMTNEQKLEQAKQFLGNKWLLHPDNQVKKLNPKPSVLEEVMKQAA